MSVIIYDNFVSAVTVDIIEEGVTAKTIIVDPDPALPFYRKRGKGLLFLDRLEIDVYAQDGKTIVQTISINAEQAKAAADAAQATANQAKNLADGATATGVQNTLAIAGLTTLTGKQATKIERALRVAESAETVAVDAISRASINEQDITLVTEQSDDNARKVQNLETQYGEIKNLAEGNDQRLVTAEGKLTELETGLGDTDKNLEDLTTEISENYVREGSSTFLEALTVPDITATKDMRLKVLETEVLGLYPTHGSFAKVGFLTGNMLARAERASGHFVTWGELKKELPKAAADEVTPEEVKLSVYHGWTPSNALDITEQDVLNGTLTDDVHGDEHIHNAPEEFDHLLEASFSGVRGDGVSLLAIEEAKRTFIAYPKNKTSTPINLSIHGQQAEWSKKDLSVNGKPYEVLVSNNENLSPQYSMRLGG